MVFKKGNKIAIGNKGGGRKGYEYENDQIKKMKKILNGVLLLAEKIQSGKANDDHFKRFETLMKLNLKIMDKLHANKQHIEAEISGELPVRVIVQQGDFKKEEQ